jgi:hypothetical protein
MAFEDYLTTTCDIYTSDNTRNVAGAVRGDVFSLFLGGQSCTLPMPIDQSKGETLGRAGLILDTKILMGGPRRGLTVDHQIRIGSRRFDVDSELDQVGYGRVIKVLCREVVG